MNEQQVAEMKQISENIIECWTRIKAKARARGDITNIEKYAPCLTGGLNAMEGFITEVNRELIRQNQLERSQEG